MRWPLARAVCLLEHVRKLSQTWPDFSMRRTKTYAPLRRKTHSQAEFSEDRMEDAVSCNLLTVQYLFGGKGGVQDLFAQQFLTCAHEKVMPVACGKRLNAMLPAGSGLRPGAKTGNLSPRSFPAHIMVRLNCKDVVARLHKRTLEEHRNFGWHMRMTKLPVSSAKGALAPFPTKPGRRKNSEQGLGTAQVWWAKCLAEILLADASHTTSMVQK